MTNSLSPKLNNRTFDCWIIIKKTCDRGGGFLIMKPEEVKNLSKKILLVIFVIIVMFTSCSTVSETSFLQEKNELTLFVDYLNKERQKYVQPEDGYYDTIYSYMNFPKSYYTCLTENELKNLRTVKNVKGQISYEEAMYDIDIFFRMLKYSSARYDFNGGDEAYYAAKVRIEDRIKQYENKKVPVYTLAQIMSEEMGFVKDNHFKINSFQVFYKNNSQTLKYQTYLSNLFFGKDDQGYYLLENPAQYYVSCSNEDVMMVPYLSKDGSIVHTLVLYCPPVRVPSQTEIKLTEDSVNISWSPTIESSVVFQSNDYIEVENIAYCNFQDEPEIDLYQIGAKARSKDIIIVDLRQNGGQHCGGFFLGLLRHPAYQAKVGFERRTMLSHPSEIKYGQECSVVIEATPEEVLSSPGKISNCKNLIIALVNNKTGCASEDFTNYIRFINNSIIIGTNTMGHLDGGSGGEGINNGIDGFNRYLPNSGIKVTNDNGFALYYDNQDLTGKGFLPDLFVSDTGDDLVLALNMLVKNGLITEDTKETLLEKSSKYSNEDIFVPAEISDDNDNFTGKPYSCRFCEATDFEFVSEHGNRYYRCTHCKTDMDHEAMMKEVKGFWKASANGIQFTLIHGNYDSADKQIIVDNILYKPISAGNWYHESDEHVQEEFIEFDNGVIFFEKISEDKLICNLTWNGREYQNISFVRSKSI